MSKVFIGLPAYNEEPSINPLFQNIEQFNNSYERTVEVIIYDDGCTDGTKTEVMAWNDRLKIHYIDGITNKGLGTGINNILAYFNQHSEAQDVLVIMDCDNTHNPRQIADMINQLGDKPYDIVVASRYRKGAFVKGVPAHRKLVSIFAAILYKTIHPLKGARDYTCGFRLYTHQIIQKAYQHYGMPLLKEGGFSCMVELLLRMKVIGASVTEIPLDLRYDYKQSPSKMDVSGNSYRLLKKLIDWRIKGLK